MGATYVQYGAGTIAVPGWINFDASPTLRIQRLPLIGKLVRRKLNCVFEDGIHYGDIVRGLPLPLGSADGVFCSHILEHLALDDFHTALRNTYLLLRPGGIFRCIVPDLEIRARRYIASLENGEDKRAEASIEFCRKTSLGRQIRPKSFVNKWLAACSNKLHLWMWDRYSLEYALREHGFIDVVPFVIGRSMDEALLRPERDYQFNDAVSIEARKPREVA